MIYCLKKKVLQHPRASSDYNPWALGTKVRCSPGPLSPVSSVAVFTFHPQLGTRLLPFCSLTAAFLPLLALARLRGTEIMSSFGSGTRHGQAAWLRSDFL